MCFWKVSSGAFLRAMSDQLGCGPDWLLRGSALGAVSRYGLRHPLDALSLRLEHYPHARVQRFGNAPQIGQRMTLVIGRFKAADLLLRSLQESCEFLL